MFSIKLFLLLSLMTVLVNNTILKGQTSTDSLTFKDTLLIGKKNNLIINPKIKFSNLGSSKYYQSPIYFKKAKESKYQRIGFLGNSMLDKIKYQTLMESKDFSLFRKKKMTSYVYYSIYAFSLPLWLWKSFNYADKNNYYESDLLLMPRNSYIIIVGTIFFSLAIQRTVEADNYFTRAIEKYNRRLSNQIKNNGFIERF